jgi:hypothetical protein
MAAEKPVSTADLNRALKNDEQLNVVTITYLTDTETFFIHGNGSLLLQTRTKSQTLNGISSSMLFPTCRWHLERARIRNVIHQLIAAGLLQVPPGRPGLWQNADPEDLPETHTIHLEFGGANSLWEYEYGPKARKYNLAPEAFLTVERDIQQLHYDAVGSGPCTFAPEPKP